MEYYIIIICIVIGLILINELCHSLYRQYQRINIYRMAENHAKKINKELVVVGDPYYGKGSSFYNYFISTLEVKLPILRKFLRNFHTYGCGDRTVDLTGAPNCPHGIKSDLYDYLKTQPDNSQVIFISCVLEYIENIEETVKELYRVAGGPQNIFVVTVKDYSLATYFYSQDNYSSKNIIKAPPEYDSISWTKLY
jgi:hypothetical protein